MIKQAIYWLICFNCTVILYICVYKVQTINMVFDNKRIIFLTEKSKLLFNGQFVKQND